MLHYLKKLRFAQLMKLLMLAGEFVFRIQDIRFVRISRLAYDVVLLSLRSILHNCSVVFCWIL